MIRRVAVLIGALPSQKLSRKKPFGKRAERLLYILNFEQNLRAVYYRRLHKEISGKHLCIFLLLD